MTSPETIIRREGRAGRITLNRPKALNALTYEQVLEISRALAAWRDDPTVALVILDGAGERGLCAGGDIRSLYESAREGSGLARRFWRDEYVLNAAIGRYPKPYVAFMDGIVMGGGIGLSAHASHRLVTERSVLAMPETGIGLIPDVGGTWLLAHAPGNTGLYLGLTGQRMDAADAIHAGFADTQVPSQRLAELADRLANGSAPVDEIIAEFAVPPGEASLAVHRAEIDRAFAHDTVEACHAALGAVSGAWAQKADAELARHSPIGMKATFAAIHGARRLAALEDALRVEFRLAVRLFEKGEFIEGIRALVIDKDKVPRWQPPRLEEVGAEMVAALLAPMPAGEELALTAPDA
ncbi:MAG: enoyl-CoA hydratase/isomerase family protein [Hyphomicrobiaceae bacterium]